MSLTNQLQLAVSLLLWSVGFYFSHLLLTGLTQCRMETPVCLRQHGTAFGEATRFVIKNAIVIPVSLIYLLRMLRIISKRAALKSKQLFYVGQYDHLTVTHNLPDEMSGSRRRAYTAPMASSSR